MDRYNRIVDLKSEAYKKSIFLFGPRQTGKTFLLREQFPESKVYNLLFSDVFLNLSRRPGTIREELALSPTTHPIIIDEVQKLPAVLDEVQAMIDEAGATFVLTGSSARKLKRGGANLLGGRARTRHLFPLVYPEIPDYNLNRVINFGALPPHYSSDDPAEDLLSYCGNYLQEEIAAESAVRNIESFSRFLEVAAFTNGELLNFSSVASDAQVPPRTIREYFQILEDTLVGTLVQPFKFTRTRKSVGTSKFYFFDVGVANALAGRTAIAPKTEAFGKALEHLIFTELAAYLSYKKDRRELSFWRDRYGHEVDFIIGDEVAIEVKATETVSEKHCVNLTMLAEDVPFKHRIVVSLDPVARMIGGTKALPWNVFLQGLWEGEW